MYVRVSQTDGMYAIDFMKVAAFEMYVEAPAGAAS